MFVIPEHVNSIDFFRNNQYRVFIASSYFGLDLNYEIKWHKKYLKKLHLHKIKPHLFHKERGHKNIDLQKIQHHKEWVIDSIPFHEQFVSDHEKKLTAILQIISVKKYKKLVEISLAHGGLPEFFVYHKKSKTYFFVAENIDHKRNYWVHLVRDKYSICDVIILNNSE